MALQSRGPWLHPTQDFVARGQCLEIVSCLQVQPGHRVAAEVACQALGSVGADAAALVDDFVDAGGRYAQCHGQGVGAHPQRGEVVLAQDFAGMYRAHAIDGKFHVALSVVIHDFDVLGSAGCPHKAHAPLPVDADAVLASAIVLEGFELVARR